MKEETSTPSAEYAPSGDGGLLFACFLDGKGGAEAVGWPEVRGWQAGKGCLWIHMDYRQADARTFIESESGLGRVTAGVLLAEETRPRYFRHDGGLVICMRAVNVNPGATPDEMIAIRMLIQPERIITLRHRRMMTPAELRERLAEGQGPRTPGEFLIMLTQGIAERISEVVLNIDEVVDDLEGEVVTAESHALRPRLSEIRRQIVGLRRYLAPQRDLISALYTEKASWIEEMDRIHLRELSDRMLRYVEDLDSARERAMVTQEELNSRLAEQMNRNMYVLSIVAGIFLPLGLLTGLLGINVGGMPGVDSPVAFWLVCALLGVTASLMFYLFRRFRLL